MNLPAVAKIMREFEKQNERMEMTSEMMGDAGARGRAGAGRAGGGALGGQGTPLPRCRVRMGGPRVGAAVGLCCTCTHV